MLRMRTLTLLVMISLLILLPSAARAQAKPDYFDMNKAAYRGITFTNLFGHAPVPSDENQAEGQCPTTPHDQSKGLPLYTLVEKFISNLEAYKPTGQPDIDLKGRILTALKDLKQYMDEHNSPDMLCIKTCFVRSFFEEDVKTKFDNSVVREIFKKFDALQGDNDKGLTLPWLKVMTNKKHVDFLNLVFDPRFLQVMGAFTYQDFFEISVQPDVVTDELIDLAQRVLASDILGSFPWLSEHPNNPPTLDTLAEDNIKSTNMCCNRTTRKCVSIANPALSCTMCGSYCCLSASWCP
jgi:hypothetical protein